MKIGNLDFRDYAANKPIGFGPTGDYITASDILEQPALALGSPFALTPGQQQQLTLARYEPEPDFRLGIIGAGLVTKGEMMDHIRDYEKDAIGQEAVRAEMGYCSELTGELAAGIAPAWPPIPSQPSPTVPNWRRSGRCIKLKLTNRALFCENTTDGVTGPFARYRIAHVHPVFAARGFNLVVLQGNQDVRANFIAPATNALTVYLSGIGHGAYPLYTGHWGDHILEVGHYDAGEVRGKAAHFLSCQTARDLGPDTVAKGAKSYAGYSENFYLVWDDGTTPAVNEFELFARSDSTFDIAMGNGATAGAAFDATIAAFNAARALVPGTVAASWLTWDRDHLRLHGDRATAIAPYRTVRICFPILVAEQEDALARAGELSS